MLQSHFRFAMSIMDYTSRKMTCLCVALAVAILSTTLCQDYEYNFYSQPEPDYDHYGESQREFDRYPEPRPEYDRYPEPRSEYDRYPEPRPEYDRYPGPRSEYDRYPEPRPEYDRYPGPQPEYDRYPEPEPDYDRYPQHQLEYSRLFEPHPDFDRNVEPHPDYDGYAQRQPDYDNYVQTSNQPRQQCAIECDCPINFPSAMYCEDRNLHFIPVVPPGIKYLYLQNNMIQEIKSKVFDNATDLLWLILDRNYITSENIEEGTFDKLDRLQKLFFSFNNLTEPVRPLAKSLNELRLMGNKLSNFPLATLSGLENLTALYLQGNELTSESIDGAFTGLDSLVYLDLSGNQLNKLPASLPGSLETLYADQNNIYSIPDSYLQNLQSLQYLRLSHNVLADTGIPGGTFNISSLIELDLSFNILHTIPKVHENLENLYLQVNRITRFDITSFCQSPGSSSKLKFLRLDGNNISRRSLSKEIPTCLRRVTMLLID